MRVLAVNLRKLHKLKADCFLLKMRYTLIKCFCEISVKAILHDFESLSYVIF